MAVLVDKWEETPELIRIFATIYVEKEGQKGIIIGAGGAMLKRIGTLAREEMERFFGQEDFPRSARQGAAGLAREASLSRRARLAYNGRER